MHEINRNLRYDLFAEPGRCSDEWEETPPKT
jgi:hypothetical protein